MEFLKHSFNLIAARLFYDKQGRLSIFKVCAVLGVSITCFMFSPAFASFVTGVVVLIGCIWAISPVVAYVFSGFGNNNEEGDYIDGSSL